MKKFTLAGVTGIGALLLASGVLFAFSPLAGDKQTKGEIIEKSVNRTGPIYTPTSAVIFTDNMDGPSANDTVGLASRGYKTYYRGSGVQGTTATWFQGGAGGFISYNGPDTGFVAANFNAVTGTNNINSWLVLPALDIESGDSLSFFSRSPTGSTWPDSVRVMYSAVGDSVPEAASWVELGRFKVNTAGMWEWKFFTAPASGATARFAIRYAVANGGPSGANSNYIGIDAINVVEGPVTPPPTCMVGTQPTSADVDICGPGVASLTATAGDPAANLVWLNSSAQVVGSGSPFNVTVAANATYNVHDAFDDGAAVHIGPTTAIATNPFPTGNFSNGIFITVLDFIRIDSVVLKSNGTIAGNFQIWTGDPTSPSGGTLLQTAPWSVTGTADHQVYVGLNLAPGSYFMNNSYTVGSGTGILHRTTGGAVFPYTAPGLMSITGTNFPSGPTRYYYFFDMVINKVCVGPATPVNVTVLPAASTALPFSEDFESGLPCNWTFSQASGSQGWLQGDATSLSSAYWTIPPHTNFVASNDDDCNCNASEDRIISPSFNFSGYTAANQINLDFEAFYDGTYSSLAFVNVSTDGGATWTVVHTLTADPAWQMVNVDLSAYAGMSDVMIAWHHDDAGAWASGFAIDDVMIDVTCGGVPLTIDIVTDIYGTETTWIVYDATSGTVYGQGGPYVDVNPYNAAAATYQAEVCVPDGATVVFRINDSYGDGLWDGTNTGTFGISLPCQANFFTGSGAFPYGGGTPAPIVSWDSTVFVVTSIPPVAGFSLVQNAADITLTNSSTGATSYSWDFGDGNTSTDTSPSHTYTANGTYTVTLNATNACGTTTTTQSVTITGVGIETAVAQAMSIHPNPATNNVQITLGGFAGQDVEVSVVNTVGQQIFVETIANAGADITRNVDISNARKGVYFVTVKSANKLMTQKLIIK